MPRYNMRTLRGERVIQKKEGNRIKRWEKDYERFIKDAKNVLSVEEVTEEIAQTFENNAIEKEKVSLICPLTKERIAVPARYRNCRHLQCFDLKGFLAMKTKINFLNCPICNTVVENALEGLCIDKFFQKILSDVSDATEIEILSDGTFRVAPSHSAPIIPKVIDDEGPYVPEPSTTRTVDVKSEPDSDINGDIQELGSVSSFDNESESNECNDETQDLDIADTSMAGNTSQDHSTINIGETKLETDINVDNDEELDSDSSFSIDDIANESTAETQILHISDSSMAGDTIQAANSSNAKAGSRIDEKRFECGICSYSTNNSGHFQTHSRIHTGEKPFKCTQCSYESARPDHLKMHMRTHTGDKPYNCNKCSYASVQLCTLKTHMLTHTNEKPHKCSQCSYASAQPGDLKRHIRTHTGEKPFKCSHCSYASAESGNLKLHIRSHTGEKPYKCDRCSYAAARSSHLKSHMRTHI